MEKEIYKNLIFASIIAFYIYGFFPFFSKIRKDKKFKNFDFSRKIFSITMIVWATYLVVHWIFNFRYNDPILAAILNLSCYYIGGNLIEISLSSLIKIDYPRERRVKNSVLKWIVFNVLLVLSYFFAPDEIRWIVIAIFSLFFVIEVVIGLSYKFFKLYKEVINSNYAPYGKSIEIFAKWMQKSVYCIIALGILGSVVAFATSYVISVYLVAGFSLFTYIFFSYQNFYFSINSTNNENTYIDYSYNNMLNNTGFAEQNTIIEPAYNTSLKNFEPTVTDDSVQNERPIYSSIELSLKTWINNKGFVKNGVTIVDLAEEVGTNRTYLSAYINKRYNLSFREWITYMRIEYAKRLLLQNESLSANRIAEMVGYSPNSFATVFAKCNDNMTPTKWRNLNKFQDKVLSK